jgi:hypothetical protein
MLSGKKTTGIKKDTIKNNALTAHYIAGTVLYEQPV